MEELLVILEKLEGKGGVRECYRDPKNPEAFIVTTGGYYQDIVTPYQCGVSFEDAKLVTLVEDRLDRFEGVPGTLTLQMQRRRARGLDHSERVPERRKIVDKDYYETYWVATVDEPELGTVGIARHDMPGQAALGALLHAWGLYTPAGRLEERHPDLRDHTDPYG